MVLALLVLPIQLSVWALHCCLLVDDAVWLRSVLLCDSRMTWHDLALVMFSLVHTYPGIRVYGYIHETHTVTHRKKIDV